MVSIDRKMSPIFKLINYKIVVFEEIYILFHFNIILTHNGMYSTKIIINLLVDNLNVILNFTSASQLHRQPSSN